MRVVLGFSMWRLLARCIVQGTINVLKAAKKSKVKRVVLTSSISALVPNPGWSNDRVFDETSWTDLDYCKSRKVYITCVDSIQHLLGFEIGLTIVLVC